MSGNQALALQRATASLAPFICFSYHWLEVFTSGLSHHRLPAGRVRLTHHRSLTHHPPPPAFSFARARILWASSSTHDFLCGAQALPGSAPQHCTPQHCAPQHCTPHARRRRRATGPQRFPEVLAVTTCKCWQIREVGRLSWMACSVCSCVRWKGAGTKLMCSARRTLQAPMPAGPTLRPYRHFSVCAIPNASEALI